MEIKKETIVTLFTTDNKQIAIGKRYIFNAQGKCFTGTFLGIANKGALKFKGVIVGHEVVFNVMPKSIAAIYESEV